MYILLDKHLDLHVHDIVRFKPSVAFFFLGGFPALVSAFPLGRFLAVNVSKTFLYNCLYIHAFLLLVYHVHVCTRNCHNLPCFVLHIDLPFLFPSGFASLLTVVSTVQNIVNIVHGRCFVDAICTCV